MKAKLIFDLSDPDQRKDHLRCVKSLDLACALWDLQTILRERRKDWIDDKAALERINDLIQTINLEEYMD